MIFIDRMMICPDKVRQFYCKVRQVLQSATIGTKWDRCSSKYANDSRLMNTSCRYIGDNHQYVFRLHCLFFYHYLMVSLLFLNCLTLIFNVLLRATPCKYRPKCGKARTIKIALLLHTGRL